MDIGPWQIPNSGSFIKPMNLWSPTKKRDWEKASFRIVESFEHAFLNLIKTKIQQKTMILGPYTEQVSLPWLNAFHGIQRSESETYFESLDLFHPDDILMEPFGRMLFGQLCRAEREYGKGISLTSIHQKLIKYIEEGTFS